MADTPVRIKNFQSGFKLQNGDSLNTLVSLLNSSIYLNAGVPVNGTSGTGVRITPKGALIIDTTNGALYQNTGTLASPTWVTAQAGGAGSFTTFTASGAALFTGGVTITTADLTITDRNVVLNTVTGTKIGTAVGQKLGFWNATPVIQQASAAQAAVTPSGAGAFDGADTVGKAAVLAAVQAVETLVNRLRLDLVTTGVIKGAA